MKILIFAFFIASCQDYNSNSSDRSRYSASAFPETDPNFQLSFTVLQKNCMSCHDVWAEYRTNDRWEKEGLIIKSSPVESQLIRRIINSGHAGESNMPPGGPAIKSADYEHLKKWVNEIP